MTVPTLILIGERDGVTPAEECRNMVDGRDEMGLSRQKDQGAPIKLVVYPGMFHGPTAPSHRVDIMMRYIGWWERYVKPMVP